MAVFNTLLVGCGAISGIHAAALHACPNAQLVAVYDIDRQRAQLAAETYTCQAYVDYASALADPTIQVVHLCTPHYLHASMTIQALKAGKHVLVEKPMAISSSDASEMIRVAESSGRQLGVCFQNRYNSSSQRMRELLDSGQFGAILGGKAVVTWHRDAAYYASASWRGTREQEGGGVLINQAIHSLDLLQWFMGGIEAVQGTVATRILPIEVEDCAEATLHCRNGTTALLYATTTYQADSPVEVELICEKARLSIRGQLTIHHLDGSQESYPEIHQASGQKAYWGSGHSDLINDFYQHLDTGRAYWLDGRAAKSAVDIVQAIYQSSRSRKLVGIKP